ncbi:hypothetical protein HQ45_05275 [Porphyromonas crevioricanis]|uniref:hypothetical protein n=1 Tax=Porphyromonas crevioricanis TaxID=393921 RepID=UPI00052C7466|nr:hypothetical protein [Porphyromonas crevioricanis]KGN90205.1 hypothetical protein HQ45_05275 [Porphyromonas crevioricanis]
MIPFTGPGIILVLVVYFGGILLVGKLPFVSSLPFKTQVLLVLLTHVVLSVVNYFLAKFLNRNGVKNTVASLRLEKVVLFMSIVFSFIILLMVYGEFKE